MESEKVSKINKVHEVELALRERIKELVCLYGISQVATELCDLSIDEILNKVLELIPPAWQYPEITSAKIILDEKEYNTSNFREGIYKQSAEIIINNKKRGCVEIHYCEKKPLLDEGPFLKEERNLIDAIAKELALILERKESEEEKAKLQNQLQHADRLATVGELSAGVAHELNEPLATILGFAQLLKKNEGLNKQAINDIDKIINSSIHAREIVKKLMFFSRQMPTERKPLNLNEIISEGLYFLESRCAKSGIELIITPYPDLPLIVGDAVQLHQVLVNLVVNAIQAMPEGGKLNVSTSYKDNTISMIVEDTGCGMSEEVKKQLFKPFFTTKEIGKGTGLGLSVVYGIVDSHNGTIEVNSEIGKGTKFEIKLPLS